jgi:hypothetical protein
MHPPFGFALFYLRGIADTLYKDGAIKEKVLSKDIYLGAIPWVIMQLILVMVVIFVPATVTTFLDKPIVVDLDSIQIDVPKKDDYGSESDQDEKIRRLNESLNSDDKK